MKKRSQILFTAALLLCAPALTLTTARAQQDKAAADAKASDQ
jgi:hypothetical protein